MYYYISSILLFLTPMAWAQTVDSLSLIQDPVDPPADLREDFDALREEFSTARENALNAFRDAKTDAEKDKAYQNWISRQAEIGARALAMAEKNPKNPLAPELVLWVVQNVADVGKGKESPRSRAVELAIRDHVRSYKVTDVIPQLSYAMDEASEKFLRAVQAKNATPRIRGAAWLALAESRNNLVQVVTRLRKNPKAFRQLQENELSSNNRYLVFLGPDLVAKAAQMDTQKLVKESGLLFEQVIEKYGEVVTEPEPTPITLGELAKDALFAARFAVGNKIAEMESHDLTGKKVRLSDYKGKVIVLTVWAAWCPACRTMISRQRELVKKMEGKPFALINISVDEDMEALKDFLKREPMPWAQWYNGATGGVVDAWRLRTVPKTFVLDAQGVIRHQGLRGRALETAAAALVKQAEAEGDSGAK